MRSEEAEFQVGSFALLSILPDIQKASVGGAAPMDAAVAYLRQPVMDPDFLKREAMRMPV